ncbi:uncharacterized protein DS421_8g245400 [Arachis hypogaea]|nr:uncharacterized protein DS421_8g245400 [Arachis hypogaea]
MNRKNKEKNEKKNDRNVDGWSPTRRRKDLSLSAVFGGTEEGERQRSVVDVCRPVTDPVICGAAVESTSGVVRRPGAGFLCLVAGVCGCTD